MSYRVLNDSKPRPAPMHTNLEEQKAVDDFYSGKISRLPASVLALLFDSNANTVQYPKRGRQRKPTLFKHPEWMAARWCRRGK